MKKIKETAECCPPAESIPPVPTSEQEANENLDRLAKAIAHPARVAIVRLLAREEGCIVGDIVNELPYAQSTVSQHLKQLRRTRSHSRVTEKSRGMRAIPKWGSFLRSVKGSQTIWVFDVRSVPDIHFNPSLSFPT